MEKSLFPNLYMGTKTARQTVYSFDGPAIGKRSRYSCNTENRKPVLMKKAGQCTRKIYGLPASRIFFDGKKYKRGRGTFGDLFHQLAKDLPRDWSRLSESCRLPSVREVVQDLLLRGGVSAAAGRLAKHHGHAGGPAGMFCQRAGRRCRDVFAWGSRRPMYLSEAKKEKVNGLYRCTTRR